MIHADASYSWTVHDVGGRGRASRTFRGTLPKRVFDEVSASCKESGQFKKVRGVPSYEYDIDDHRTKHPEGIQPLVLFLMGRHLRTSALRAGKRKTIEDGWGSAAPVELWAIEMAIDGLIAQVTDWKKTR